jgi:hypothetical protein
MSKNDVLNWLTNNMCAYIVIATHVWHKIIHKTSIQTKEELLLVLKFLKFTNGPNLW